MSHRPTLGAFRFALTVIVFTSHIVPRPFHFFYTMTHGFIAVQVFFIISGYLISNALETFYANRVGDFAINRALRLYPCFWIVLIVNLLFSTFYADPVHGFGDATTLTIKGFSNTQIAFAFIQFDIIGMNWSLRIELMFYICAFCTYLLCSFVPDRRIKAVLVNCVCWAALGFYVWTASTGDWPWAHPYPFISFFIVGIVISRIGLRRDYLVAAIPLALVAFCLMYVAFDHTATPATHLRLFEPVGLRLGPDAYNVINLVALLFVLLVCLCADIGNGWLRKTDNFFGNLAYPLFVSHYTVNGMIGHFFESVPEVQRMWLAIVVALLVAYLLWFLVDRPLEGLRQRIRGMKLY